MIAYFVYNLDSYSGAAQQALKLSNALSNKIVFFNFNYTKIEKSKIDGNIIINMGKNKLLNLLSIIYYSYLYDLKIYHLHGFFLYGLLLGGVLRRKVILKTTMMGDDDFKSIKKRKFGTIKLWLINKVVDINIVLTEKTKEININHFSKDKIVKIPNGVDINLEQVIVKERNSFCFVGLVCERKNTLESIKYFNKFYKNLDEAKLYIVGPYENIENISDFTDEYVQSCFKYVRDENLDSKVIFTGKLSKNDTYEIYKRSKALLFFSKKEGMPNVLLEAMAHNCVPIVSEMDGVSREIIVENSGYILEEFSSCVDIKDINFLIYKKIMIKTIKEKYQLTTTATVYDKIYSELNGMFKNNLSNYGIITNS